MLLMRNETPIFKKYWLDLVYKLFLSESDELVHKVLIQYNNLSERIFIFSSLVLKEQKKWQVQMDDQEEQDGRLKKNLKAEDSESEEEESDGEYSCEQ